MKIVHKNSRATILGEGFPQYWKHEGCWGYLIIDHRHRILFIYDDPIQWTDVSNEFEIYT